MASNSPYEIETAAHLKALADCVNAGNCATKDVYYKLMNDIDLSGYASGDGWKPIGKIQGNFDGNSKIIKNLTINRPSQNSIGLFGGTNNATIQNLGLENCNIVGGDNVGALVGHSFLDTKINNCYATGTVNGRDDVGGLAGMCEISSFFENCYTTGTVNGRDYVGGLVGGNLMSNVNNVIYSIKNCHSLADVSGTGRWVGGLMGFTNSCSIYDSYAKGKVSGSGSHTDDANTT